MIYFYVFKQNQFLLGLNTRVSVLHVYLNLRLNQVLYIIIRLNYLLSRDITNNMFSSIYLCLHAVVLKKISLFICNEFKILLLMKTCTHFRITKNKKDKSLLYDKLIIICQK